jgi:hypothetical protein
MYTLCTLFFRLVLSLLLWLFPGFSRGSWNELPKGRAYTECASIFVTPVDNLDSV